MAVNNQYLGQQVRCPHCQQIVIAPPAAPASPKLGEEKTEIVGVAAPPADLPETALRTPDFSDAAEDIFSPAGGGSDLFGRGDVPQIEIPLESLPPTLPVDNLVPPPSQATLSSELPWLGQVQSGEMPVPLDPLSQSENTAVRAGDPASPWEAGSRTETMQAPLIHVPLPTEGGTSSDQTHTAGRTEAKAPWFLLLVFCPLLLYSIVISIFAFFIYRHDEQLREQLRERFDKMLDVGDDPGVRKGKKVTLTDRYKPELATLPLPLRLCTGLGKPLRIGDLQITPSRVERKRVSVVVESSRPEPCKHDSLVLYLDLKNMSSEYAFAPLDNYFDRHWHPGVDQIPPLTLLEVENRNKYRCYGGPAHWHPRGDPSNPREWVQGRSDQADLLQPGEEKKMFVCTDGDDDKAASVLFGDRLRGDYRGPYLWRVRVRRGLVRIEDKDYSATAVVGIRFTSADIRLAELDVP